MELDSLFIFYILKIADNTIIAESNIIWVLNEQDKLLLK